MMRNGAMPLALSAQAVLPRLVWLKMMTLSLPVSASQTLTLPDDPMANAAANS